jgi:hypothetical protein
VGLCPLPPSLTDVVNVAALRSLAMPERSDGLKDLAQVVSGRTARSGARHVINRVL